MRCPSAIAAFLALIVLPNLAFRPAPLLGQTPPAPSSQTVEDLKKTALRVFLDCDDCDTEYIKTEITFVNYVRDRLEAQVHILISTQSTGGGGTEYTLTFIGQNGFKGIEDIQKYYSIKTDTDDDVRRGLVKALKLGLAGFVARTPIGRRLAVDYTAPQGPAAARDRWNSWVFSLSGEGMFSGEESYKSRMVFGNFSANRVTPASKVRLGLSVSEERQRYRVEDGTGGFTTITGTSSSWEASGLYVKSLGEHWSAGIFVDADSSYYSNVELGLRAAPAVEYNFFRYSQSTRRQLRALYTLSLRANRYRETTVFGKLKETLVQESLSLSLDLREKLGTISVAVEAENYLQHFAQYRVNTFSVVNLRLYKGLSVYVLGGYSWIHDQRSLLGREPTYEELLLRLRELPMNDNYFVAVGFQFQFGSIFTNVINPRFGSTGGGGLSIHMD